MKQTPVHDIHNHDLLKLFPPDLKRILEVGCSSGALAREYKKVNAACHYTGLEINGHYAELAQRYCDDVLVGNIEILDDKFWSQHSNVDCWVFADVLEHLKDPWGCLRKVCSILPSDGQVLACIPNVQHWSIPVKISLGHFIYEELGLLDKTHLRWFTRKTILDLFQSSGFVVEEIIPRIFDDPASEGFLEIIQALASKAGGDPSEARRDALPLQYLVRAKKIG